MSLKKLPSGPVKGFQTISSTGLAGGSNAPAPGLPSGDPAGSWLAGDPAGAWLATDAPGAWVPPPPPHAATTSAKIAIRTAIMDDAERRGRASDTAESREVCST